MSKRTLENGRARAAYEAAQAGANIDKKKAYKAYSKRIPVYVKTNGFGAAMAFVKGKAKTDKKSKEYAYHLLFDTLEKWLRERMPELFDKHKPASLVDLATLIDSAETRRVTLETFAFMGWVRRFADGLIEGEDDED